MRKILAVLLVMLLSLSLFANGEKESSTASATNNVPVDGGRMVISAKAPKSRAWYDIRGIMGVASFQIIYEPIMRYGADGTPEAFLAESMIPDPDNLTWTIKVRPGVKFHDGSDLNAEVIKWNLDFYRENGILKGSFFKYYDYSECTDNMTVVCHFKEWDSLFDYSLCRTVLVASKKAFDEHGLDWLKTHPIGTGPFKEAEYNADVSWILDRNPDYWQGHVYLDGLDLITYQQELVAATALNAGQIDAMTTENFSLAQQMKSYKGITSKAAELPTNYYTLCFHMRGNDPFADVRVRKAVSHALDVDSLIDTITFGYAKKTNQWALPGTPFYNEDALPQEYNLEKAKALLVEAGYPNGFETTITCSSQSLAMTTCQVIANQLEKVGIKVTIRPIEGAAFVNYIGGWNEGMFLHMMGAEAGAASQYSSTFYNYEGSGLGTNSFVIDDDLHKITTSITKAKTTDELIATTKKVADVVFDEQCIVKVLFGTRAVSFQRDVLQDCHYCELQNLRYDVWETWKK